MGLLRCYQLTCFLLEIRPLSVNNFRSRLQIAELIVILFLVLEFHHDEKNEARWLIAGAHDRKVKFFDTHNVSIEISTSSAHSRIVAGCWPIHWTSFLLGIDNAYSLSKLDAD